MEQKKILILGGGISGLSSAWFLHRRFPQAKITLLEKTDRLGGWIDTDHSRGFHFEKGPRAFKVSKASHILDLARELNLEGEIVWKKQKELDRYLWLQEELHRLPNGLFSFLLSPMMRPCVKALLSEWKIPPVFHDETVWEFAARRLGPEVASRFFDPLVVGIFGGDARQISVSSCFPVLKQWEREAGSLTAGMWCALKKRRPPQTAPFPASAFFSFRKGMHQLIEALAENFPGEIRYGVSVESLEEEAGKWRVGAEEADLLICALPVQEAARLFRPHSSELVRPLEEIGRLGFAIVNVGYRQPVLQQRGFGYLTSSAEEEKVLGCVFDSCLFDPMGSQETRLTIKLKEKGQPDETVIQDALEGIKKHLGISAAPDAVSVKRVVEAIPQYGVGHQETISSLQKKWIERYPTCRLVGNYLTGVAVDQCIAHAQHMVNDLI